MPASMRSGCRGCLRLGTALQAAPAYALLPAIPPSPSPFSGRRNAEYWWIHSVYVEPDQRRQGVFKAMFDHVEAEARVAGAAGLKLYTESSNERAHRAYRERGMESHAVVFERVWVPY